MSPKAEPRKSIRVEHRPNGVSVVVFDAPDEPVNTLKESFAADFEAAFDEVDQNRDVKAVVLASGKPKSFIAGADIKMLKAAQTVDAAVGLSRLGQKAMDRVDRCKVPVVAAIVGPCLGGGLEVALACQGRVAASDSGTKLGLPEVQLGILPGMGGTQRLPRLVGVRVALDLLLTGKQIDPRRALKMGLVDELAPGAIVVEVACKRALELWERRDEPKKAIVTLRDLIQPSELTELALAENPLGRKVLFDQARKKLLQKTRGNYPAPEKILDVVRLGLERGMRRGLEAESEAFGELAVSPVASELMQIFFSQQALKKDPGVEDDVAPEKVSRVGVLGAGLMGVGVAYVSVQNAGTFVRLKERDTEGLARGMRHVRGLLDERVGRRRMTPTERDFAMNKITSTTGFEGFVGCQVVIEAVFEDLKLKREMLAAIEEHGGESTIFASNTSSLPIAEIARDAKHPERVIGMHYFSPVQKMPLLEIVVTDDTAPWVTATCVELGKRQGKTVIVVSDGSGFYTSRILAPYMNEAAFALAEGNAVQAIDQALIDFGFPVGPIALLDEVGIDVGQKVGKIMYEAFGERMAPPPGMGRLVDGGRLGRKNERGFYVYEGHEKKKGPRPVDTSVYELLGIEPVVERPSEEVAERCALQMVNEAAHCLGEGILRTPRDGDIGAIFGLGFPPHLGGPFRYVDAVGAKKITERLEHYVRKFGERFAPAPELVARAKSGVRFYPE